MEYFALIFSAIFAQNVILRQFWGICPFLGVSTRVSTSVGMSGAVVFVMTLATIVTHMIFTFILKPFQIEFLRTVSFILVIATLVQMVELVLKKVSPILYQALGVFLPLITTNCAILGVAESVTRKEYGMMESIAYSIGISIGFGLAIILFAGIRERLEMYDIPEAMKGAPIALIAAGLLSLAFSGFA